MKVVFLGVGEAFNELQANNSHLILSKTKLLLDCGFSAVQQLWKYSLNQSLLNAVFLSHGHADHFFGIPALITRMNEEKRKKPLTIICQKNFSKKVKELIKKAYPKVLESLEFELNFVEVKEKQKIFLNELELEFALTKHSLKNLAIKVSNGKRIVCYSGDGNFTKNSVKLFKDADLLIHEAYFFNKKSKIHANIKELIEMAEKNKIKCLALTHIQRNVLKKEFKKILKEKSKTKVKVIIPKEFQEIVLR
jgi:ribonuclease BN (tRNA processing enzyme)